MAGYDAARRMARDAPSAVTGAITGVVWTDEGRAFEYDQDGKRYRYDVSRRAADEIVARTGRGRRAWRRPRFEHGGAGSRPAGRLDPVARRKLKAVHLDRNVWISDADARAPAR